MRASRRLAPFFPVPHALGRELVGAFSLPPWPSICCGLLSYGPRRAAAARRDSFHGGQAGLCGKSLRGPLSPPAQVLFCRYCRWRCDGRKEDVARIRGSQRSTMAKRPAECLAGGLISSSGSAPEGALCSYVQLLMLRCMYQLPLHYYVLYALLVIMVYKCKLGGAGHLILF